MDNHSQLYRIKKIEITLGIEGNWECLTVKEFIKIQGHSIDRIDNKVYVFGGMKIGGSYRNNLICFNTNL